MKERKTSLIEILLIECFFFFAFFAVLKYMGIGNPRLFIGVAFLLLAGYFLIGIARYIEMQKAEEEERKILAGIK